MTSEAVPMGELERALLREVISCGHIQHWDFRYPIEDDDAWKALLAAALAYARPIVAEECAKIAEAVELDYTPVPGVLKILERDLLAQVRILVKRMKMFTAAAIREHGRSK